MAKFSEREGISKPSTEIQVRSMNDRLRNRIWDAISEIALPVSNRHDIIAMMEGGSNPTADQTAVLVWTEFLGLSRDCIPSTPDGRYQEIRRIFFDAKWYEVYDLIEIIFAEWGEYGLAEAEALINHALERENSGFRYFNRLIVPISSEIEIDSIHTVLATSNHLAREHIRESLKLLSNKQTTDYRNSVREAISAVEAACRDISGKPNATLGDALKSLGNKVPNHTSLSKAFHCLYGYTSDAGIRHAIKDDHESVDLAFGKYMLVTCSAFINYLTMLKSY